MSATGEYKPVFFDARRMGEPEYNYVCWLDVMGTKNQMLRSLPTSANFIYKLQCAAIESHEETADPEVNLYPVMDGVYITSARRDPLMLVLSTALRRLAETFLKEPTIHHRFLVRGAIAFGPVQHGREVQKEASWALARHPRERDSIILGIPMAQAYLAEPEAPPYGIAIDASARAFCPMDDRPFSFIWWDWYRKAKPELVPEEMLKELNRYFEWQKEHTHTTGYDPKRIEYHQELAIEYFGR